jgi:hypothetical protein
MARTVRPPGRALRPGGGIAGAPADPVAVAEDEQHIDERLDVVDRRRLPEEPDLDREGRLVARLAAPTLDRFEEGGLLAADVGPGATPELDVEGPARAGDVVAEEAGRPGGLDRRGQASLGQRVLTPEVEVAARRARGEALDRDRLDDRERVGLHEHAVLERARFGFVGVAHDVMGLGRLGGDGGPLPAGGERRPATAEELRL